MRMRKFLVSPQILIVGLLISETLLGAGPELPYGRKGGDCPLCSQFQLPFPWADNKEITGLRTTLKGLIDKQTNLLGVDTGFAHGGGSVPLTQTSVDRAATHYLVPSIPASPIPDLPQPPQPSPLQKPQDEDFL